MKQTSIKFLIFSFLLFLNINSYSEVLGSYLFNGGFNNSISLSDDDNYKIQSGDRINISTWGVSNSSNDYFVDLKGNIFIPEIGPVKVSGLTNSELNKRIEKEFSKIFKDNFNSYSRIDTLQKINVFVSGKVDNPGFYSGYPNSTFLYFLQQSGGINEGSYRNLSILRNGEIVKKIDLYDFISEGKYDNFQLKNNDVIFVNQPNKMISVVDLEDNKEIIELKKEEKGEKILSLLKINPKVASFIIKRNKDNKEIIKNLSKNDFKNEILQDGDEVKFVDYKDGNNIIVKIDGAKKGKNHFVVNEKTSIQDLLSYIEVDPEIADIKNIYIKRESVKQAQKEAIKNSVQRLKETYYLASSDSPEESKIRTEEAKMIEKFTEDALNIEPEGILVISENDEINDIRLEDGDVIFIPKKDETVSVSGAILAPKAIVYNKDYNLEDYIERTGGFTSNANEDKILVKKNNGAMIAYKGEDITPGEKIIVLPKAPEKTLIYGSIVTQMIYQIAVATSVVLGI